MRGAEFRSQALLGALALGAVLVPGCGQPRLLTKLRYHEAVAGYSDSSPWSVQQIVKRFPELDGILVDAPTFMDDLDREKADAATKGRTVEQDYRIQTGATIVVEVTGEPDLSHVFTIGPTGKIDYPFVGEVQARERTITEVRDEIREKLGGFVRNPQVLVNLTALPSLGASVFSAGDLVVITQSHSTTLQFTGDETISRVLATTDAVTDRHEWRQVRILRRGDDAHPPRMVLVDMWRLLALGDLRQNVPLKSGDIVYVPRHWTIGDQFDEDLNLMLRYFKNTIAIDDFTHFLEKKF